MINEYIFDVYNEYIDHLVILVGIYLVLSMLFYYHTLGDDSIWHIYFSLVRRVGSIKTTLPIYIYRYKVGPF